jgi:hypothetical protein
MADQRKPLKVTPPPRQQQAGPHVGVNNVRPKIKKIFVKGAHSAQQILWTSRLIQNEMHYACALKQRLVSATVGYNGNIKSLARLLHSKIHRGIHNAVAAIGYVIQNVQYPHR